MATARENWVDTAKGLAIFLVAIFHGIQGLLCSDLLPGNVFWRGSNEAAYCFHVQLLFLCSGYLWQRHGRSHGWRGHLRAVWGKVWCLGVPYVVFSMLSWIMKTLCVQSVNHPAGTLWRDLVTAPTAPYWFLPTLALLFALFPRTEGTKGWACFFAAAVAAKTATMAWNSAEWMFAARTTAQQAFWFTAGMGLAHLGTLHLRDKAGCMPGAACAVLFLAGVGAATATGIWWRHGVWWLNVAKWGFGILACTAVLAWAIRREVRRTRPGVWETLGRHTMPVFLMHTMCAAAVRIGLEALGVRTPWIHIPAMITASFAGPLATMRVLARLHLDGLVEPRRWHLGPTQPEPTRIGLPKE